MIQVSWSMYLWVGVSVILNVIVFVGFKKILTEGTREAARVAGTDSMESAREYTDRRDKQESVWRIVKLANILFWVIIFASLVLFHSMGRYSSHDDMGADKLKQEISGIKSISPEDIKQENVEVLAAPKVQRGKEVSKDREASRLEYEAARLRALDEAIKKQ